MKNGSETHLYLSEGYPAYHRKSERYGRLLLAKIREQNEKDEHQFVTVDEFCLYTGLKFEQVDPFIAG